MTPKQIEALDYIHMNGNDDLTNLSGRVLHDCCKKGWLEVDQSEPWPYGERFNECAWILTDEGRQALHEATL